jgi:superfamily II DNA or RNA helicase
MRYIFEAGRPALWLTHTKDLMYQTRDRAQSTLKGVGNIGIIGDGVTNFGDGKLTIAMVQTLKERPELISGLDYIIGTIVTDECHHFPAPMFLEAAGMFSAKRIIGLTATPDRKDRLENFMYAGIGPKLYTIERAGLYDLNQLIKPEVKFVYTDFSYEESSVRNEINSVDAGGEDIDYNTLITKLINDGPRADMVADNILKYLNRGTTIVITESVRYCFTLMARVEAMSRKIGIMPRMAVVHGGMSRYTWRVAKNENDADQKAAAFDTEYKYDDKIRRWKVKTPQYTDEEFKAWQVTGKQRKEILEKLRKKEIDILFATQLAREGLDINHLTVGHMAMPKRGDSYDSNNGGAVEQEIGRIQRPDPSDPDKAKKALWIDYVDYNVGIFQGQYYSRRKVYKRLGLHVPVKKSPKEHERDMISNFLADMPF